MTNGELLRRKIELVFPAAHNAAHRLWDAPSIDRLYPELLCWMHAISRAAVPLMRAAATRATTLGDDGLSPRLVEYFTKHIPEEQGHDEWIRQDLAALGWDPDEPLRRVPPPAVAALVGAQYYWIEHHHPAALLGFLAVVEGYPPPKWLEAKLMERTGYPRDAFRSLRRHAHLDVKHRDDLYRFVDTLELAPEHEAVIGVSALHTVDQLVAIYDEIYAAVGDPAVAAEKEVLR